MRQCVPYPASAYSKRALIRYGSTIFWSESRYVLIRTRSSSSDSRLEGRQNIALPNFHLCSCAFWVSETFQGIYEFWPFSYTFQQPKLINQHPKYTQNTYEHNDNEVSRLYFFVFNHFQAIMKSS